MRMDKSQWTMIAAGAGALAGFAAKRAAAMTWEKITDEEPPILQPEPAPKQLLLWALLSALLVTLFSTGTKLAITEYARRGEDHNDLLE